MSIMDDSTDDEDSEQCEFGAKPPPLTAQIAGVLRRYPDGGQILKELIQNADDAKATEVKFLVDSRWHSCENYLDDSFKEFQGPALYAWNNATFVPDDWNSLGKIEQSKKEDQVLKVGRFGLGFLSVFHITDLPIVISKKWVGIIDPHRKYIKTHESQAAGKKFKLKEFLEDEAHAACFNNIFGLSPQEESYPCTLFGFPLRQSRSEISSNIYTTKMIEDNLFASLKSEAKVILLFLKNILKVSLWEWHEDAREPTLVFGVEAKAEHKQSLQSKRALCLEKANTCLSLSTKACVEIHTATFTVAAEEQHWLMLNLIGSSDPKVKQLSHDLKVLPWVGLAVCLPTHVSLPDICIPAEDVSSSNSIKHLSLTIEDQLQNARPLTLRWPSDDCSSTNGQAFCFLPLPGHTAVPVHIHGYFAVADNRRSIKWPSCDDNGSAAKWNEQLLHKLIAPAYALLLNCRAFLVRYQGTPTAIQNDVCITDPYAAWPLYNEVKNKEIWHELIQPTLKLASESSLLWTSADGGKWVTANEAYFLSPTQQCPTSVTKFLVETGLPVVHLPASVRQTLCCIDSLKATFNHNQVTPKLVRNTLELVCPKMIPKEDVYGLLEYVLSDLNISNYCDLIRIPLLPLSSGFPPCQFETSSSPVKYIFPYELQKSVCFLPGIEKEVVDLDLSQSLQKKLIDIAKSGKLQLKLATAEIVCTVLLKKSIFSWCKKAAGTPAVWTPGKKNHPPLEWITQLWQWLLQLSVEVPLLWVEGLPVIPQEMICPHAHTCTPQKIHLLECTRDLQLCTLPDQTSTQYPISKLKLIIVCLGFTIVEESTMVFNHPCIRKYVPVVTPELVVQRIFASGNQSIQHLDNQVKNVLRQFIASHYGHNPIGVYKECLQSLTIFEAKNCTRLVSLDSGGFFLPPSTLALPAELQYPEKMLSAQDPLSVKLIRGLGISHLTFENFIKRLVQFALSQCANYSYPWTNGDEIILWILQQDILSHELNVFLAHENIIRTSANPKVLEKPSQLYDPNDPILSHILFNCSQDLVFPSEKYVAVLHKLQALGLKTWRSIQTNREVLRSFLKDRAESVVNLVNDNPHDALNRSKLILKLLLERQDENLWQFLSEVHFLFIQKSPPYNYPTGLEWFGQHQHSKAYQLRAVCLPTCGERPTAHLVGSVEPILAGSYHIDHERLPSYHQFHQPKVDRVVQHLFQLVKSDMADGDRINRIVLDIYNFLSEHVTELTVSPLPIWWKSLGQFVPSRKVVLKLPTKMEPYYFSIDMNNELNSKKLRGLFKHCHIRKDLEASDLIEILHKMQKTSSPLSNDDLDIALAILKWLFKLEYKSHGDILMPTTEKNLVSATHCTFDDREWTLQSCKIPFKLISRSVFVHENITVPLARYFQVKPLSERIAPSQKLSIKYTLAGQHENVTQRIRHIVQDYGTNIDIFKELIQNADDAKATEVQFLIDWRTHPSSSLFSNELAPWQGPALLTFNNSVFSDQDFEHICHLAGETKMKDPLKTGRFGVGFCATYHLTDLPSFISRQYFTVFDPHTKYLGNRVSSREPGMRIDLVESQADLKVYEDQFLPYCGIFGCNVFHLPSDGYKGTLFRFPFRDEQTAPKSDISERIYSRRSVDYLVKTLKEEGMEILLFLKHVQKVAIYELDKQAESPEEMRELFRVQKLYTPDSSERTSLIMHSQSNASLQENRLSSCRIESFSTEAKLPTKSVWLISSSIGLQSQALVSWNPTESGLVPLAEVAVRVENETPVPTPLIGKVFCFLPLPITSGLPFHINGFFDIGKDRRSLSASDDKTFGSQWNRSLAQDTLTQAFIHLLSSLAGKQQLQHADKKDEILRLYYLLWHPKHLKGVVPQQLVSSFRKEILKTRLKVVWSEVNGGCWLSPAEVVLFKDSVDGEIRREAIKLMLQQNYNVVELPDEHITNILAPLLYDMKQVYNYQRFCEEVLLPEIENIDPTLRDPHLLFLLEKVSEHRDKYQWVETLMKQRKCIPSSDSCQLSLPGELIDCQEPLFKVLYDSSEGRFPSDSLQKSVKAMRGLVVLGMASYKLKIRDLQDRATTVCRLAAHCVEAAKQRAFHILEYIHKTYDAVRSPYLFLSNTRSGKTQELQDLQTAMKEIPFLLVMEMPQGIQLPWWSGQSFATPAEVYPLEFKNLVFSQQPIAALPEGIPCTTLSCLGPSKNLPKPELVLEHMQQLITCLSRGEIQRDTQLYIAKERVMHDVYSYLQREIKVEAKKEIIVKTLQDLKFIWQDGHLLCAYQTALHWNHDCYPYMCQLSSTNKNFSELFECIGVQKEPSVPVLTGILKQISDHSGPNTPVSKIVLEFIQHLVGQLVMMSPEKEWKEDFLLPDEAGVMRPVSQLACDNIVKTEWVARLEVYRDHFAGGEGHFIHPNIPRGCAIALGVRPVLDAILKEIEDNEFLSGTDFGQEENLCDRLNSILKKYPTDTSIFQEFIQNAEDAQASEVVFVLDHRKNFSQNKLFSQEKSWKQLQLTPSLCIINNQKFSEDDIEGITKLGIGGKPGKPQMIGRFGIGFNVAYHLTDCPSFLSYDEKGFPENFCVFDPACKYVPRASKRSPGRRWKVTEKHVAEFADQFKPYLSSEFPQFCKLAPTCLQDIRKGYVVFRLPLTRMECAKKYLQLGFVPYHERSKLGGGVAFDTAMVRELLYGFRSISRDALLFLNQLRQISVFEIMENGQCIHHFTTKTVVPSACLRDCEYFSENLKKSLQILKLGKIPESYSMTHQVKVVHVQSEQGECGAFSSMKQTLWLVQKTICGIHKSIELLKTAVEHGLQPIGGVATQLGTESYQYSVFCFLPLPLKCELPVHVNGHFLTDDSRKHFETQAGLSEWNMALSIHIIAPAYVDLILKAKNFVEILGSKWFYERFPAIVTGELGNLKITASVYKELLSRDSPVLMRETLTHSQAEKSRVEWLAPSRGYFCVPFNCKRSCTLMKVSNELKRALITLGLPITNAPLKIYEHLCMVKKSFEETARIDPSKIVIHLEKLDFSQPAIHQAVKDNVKHFLSYLINADNLSDILMRIPLLVAQDGSLQTAKQNLMFESKFAALLPGCAQYFIDTTLEESFGMCLQQLGILTPLNLQFVAQHIQLPEIQEALQVSDELVSLLKVVWEYLTAQHYRSNEIHKHFFLLPIIPASDRKIYPVCIANAVINQSGDDHCIQNVMKRLGYPFVDFSVIGMEMKDLSELVKLTTSCSSANDLVRCLQLQDPPNCDVQLTPEEVHAFTESMRKGNGVERVVEVLLKMKLFETVDGSFVSLNKAEQVLVIPSGVPADGITDITAEHRRQVILKPPDQYCERFYAAVIPNYSSAIINTPCFYMSFVIPNFGNMSQKAIQTHIDYIHKQCDDPDFSCVLAKLKETPFIFHGGKLSKVSNFYDPRIEFYRTFYQDHILPEEWFTERLLGFFANIGLKRTVTHLELISGAKSIGDIQTMELCDSHQSTVMLAKRSQVLLSFVIDKVKKCCSVNPGPPSAECTGFLSVISKIPFMYSHAPPQVYRVLITVFPHLMKVHNAPCNRLVCFKGSVLSSEAELAGLCTHILPEECNEIPINALIRRTGLQIETPLSPETVVKNLLILCQKVAHTCIQLQSHLPTTLQALKKIIVSHYGCLDMKKNDAISLLRDQDAPCILVGADDNQIHLVRPSQLVKQIPPKCFLEPFCYQVPSALLQYDNFLSALGICEELGAECCAEILGKIHTEIRNYTETYRDAYGEVAASAYNELIRCLREEGTTLHGNLYLPSEDNELVKATELIHNDAPWYLQRLGGKSTFKFLKTPPPDDKGLRTLPASLGVKLLSTVVSEILHEDMDTEDVYCLHEKLHESGKRSLHCQVVQKLLSSLTSDNLSTGLYRVYYHDYKELPSEDLEYLTAIKRLQGIHVRCINRTLKTVLCKNGRPITETEDDQSLCHLTAENVLYIAPHSARFDENVFLRQLSSVINKLLNNLVKNEATISAMFQCEPSDIPSTLNQLHITPFHHTTIIPSKTHKLGDEVQLAYRDYLIFLNYHEGEQVVYMRNDGVCTYAEVVDIRHHQKLFEKSVTIKVSIKSSDGDDNHSQDEVSPLQLYKVLTPSQATALFGNGITSNTFATPLVLAYVPCGDLNEVRSWLREIFQSEELQALSGSLISQTAIRLIGHLHYQLVKQERAVCLFTQAVMEIQTLVCQTDYKDRGTDTEFSKKVDEITEDMKNLSLMEDDESETKEDQQTNDPITILTDDERLLPLNYGAPDSQAKTPTHDASFSRPYALPPQSASVTAKTLPSTHQVSGSLVQPPPQVQYPMQPRFTSARRGHRPITNQRFYMQPVVEQPRTLPEPPVCLQSARMWLEQAKADFRGAEYLMESMKEAEPNPASTSESIAPSSQRSCAFPALVCFLCHETVEKSIKGVLYVFCGVPPELVNSSHLIALLKFLTDSPHAPEVVIPPIRECVMLINEHENKSRLPNFQIPPCAPAAVYTALDAHEAFSAVSNLLQRLQEDLTLKDLLGDLGELPKVRFLSTLKSMTGDREDYPDFWDPHLVEECKLVLLDPVTDSEEYDRVADRFLQTMPNVSSLEIQRIQNRVVWAKYRDCCRRMLEFNGILREEMLFHGSTGTDPKQIYAGDASFDMRFSGNGMWGKGNYFAVNASYSNGFAYHARGGYKKVLVAWVLTGYSYSSEPFRFDKPPIRTAECSNGEIQCRYDSITGVTGGSKVYITYENDRAYPAYIVTYF